MFGQVAKCIYSNYEMYLSKLRLLLLFSKGHFVTLYLASKDELSRIIEIRCLLDIIGKCLLLIPVSISTGQFNYLTFTFLFKFGWLVSSLDGAWCL